MSYSHSEVEAVVDGRVLVQVERQVGGVVQAVEGGLAGVVQRAHGPHHVGGGVHRPLAVQRLEGLELAAVGHARQPVRRVRREHLVGVQAAEAVVPAHAAPLAQHLHALHPTSGVTSDSLRSFLLFHHQRPKPVHCWT